jgi:C1A family cysteine protease
MTQRTYGLKLERPTPEKLSALQAQVFPAQRVAVLAHVDLRAHMPPVFDQGQLGSCTANALCALMQYLEPRVQGSRLFLYYNERAMEGDVDQDAGACIADGIQSLKTKGICEEATWPYDPAKFAVQPPQACYAAAVKHEALSVYSVPLTLAGLKAALVGGHPVAVGISIYESFESAQVAQTGVVPLPRPGEALLGGHAVAIVGFDDAKQTFLLRNSWGPHWGQGGHFTLPYAYLTNPQLASDAWAILSATP